jgi:hypothetical protein
MYGYVCQPVPRCEGAAIQQRVNEEAAAAVIAESMGHDSDALVVSFDGPPDFETDGSSGAGGTFFDTDYERDEEPQPSSGSNDQNMDCDLCGGVVEVAVSQAFSRRDRREVVTSVTHVAMKGCIVTGGCEQAWGEQHPDFYNPEVHDPKNTPEKAPTPELLPCRGERCSAILRFLSPHGRFLGKPIQVSGECGVDVAGKIWQAEGIDTLNRMQPSPIGDEIERFDGETVTAADIRAIEARAGIAGDGQPDAE